MDEINEGHNNLERGVFDFAGEVSFIATVLRSAGCKIVSDPQAQCTVLFTGEL